MLINFTSLSPPVIHTQKIQETKKAFFEQETVFETEFQAKKTQQGVKDQNPLTKKKEGFVDLFSETWLMKE